MTSTALVNVDTLAEQYQVVRRATEELCEPLAIEDYVVQSMTDASPTRWHLAHTSWFFETMVLMPMLPNYHSPDTQYGYLFNSYYNTIGKQFYRPHRGLLTRPTVEEVREYRAHVDRHMAELFERADELDVEVPEAVITVGLNHEQQHQELILTDLKHLFSFNPLYPAYSEVPEPADGPVPDVTWIEQSEGIVEVGHAGDGFAYDNETPRHRVFVHGFRLASRLVTCDEYQAFMADGGYERAELWLSDGWYAVQEEGWHAPLYWKGRDGEWWQFTLSGMRKVIGAEPVCHVSLYEADAYARWVGARLPTEVEWETIAASQPVSGNFVEERKFHALPLESVPPNGAPAQLFGDVWEWSQSPYTAYPGYRPPEGALGEYNAKFMSNQYVLRGGSCATPRSHIRATYRNFFPPAARWQFSGIRLARDGD